MSLNLGGIEYEERVSAILKESGFDVDNTAGFSSVGAGDINTTYKGKPFNIECKSDKKDQMGGTSVRCDFDADTYEIVEPHSVDEAAVPYYIEAARSKREAYMQWADFILGYQPDHHPSIPNAIPFGSVTKDAWTAAQQNGYLKGLNKKEIFDNVSTIVAHYNKKEVFYIQLGKAGLYYMGDNPLDLDIPELDAEMQVEFRLGRSGSSNKKFGEGKIKVVGAGYRCQGRLKSFAKSKYSLDNPEDVRKLFQ